MEFLSKYIYDLAQQTFPNLSLILFDWKTLFFHIYTLSYIFNFSSQDRTRTYNFCLLLPENRITHQHATLASPNYFEDEKSSVLSVVYHKWYPLASTQTIPFSREQHPIILYVHFALTSSSQLSSFVIECYWRGESRI